MKPIQFYKMHGLGNDFVVIDGVSQTIVPQHIPIKKFAHRHSGIGFDQLLLVQPSKIADFACRIFNSDGSEAEQCGNGMRCVARFIHEMNLSPKKTLTIETLSGVVATTLHDFLHIDVDMGLPKIEENRSIKCNDQSFDLAILSMGNPHAILQVPSIKDYPVATIGALISTHPAFSHGTNVGFMEIVNRSQIRLRTFERGSGETLACGSNSCAAVVAGIENNLLDPNVKVELALGHLDIAWPSKTSSVMMSGPAEKVFEGVVK